MRPTITRWIAQSRDDPTQLHALLDKAEATLDAEDARVARMMLIHRALGKGQPAE